MYLQRNFLNTLIVLLISYLIDRDNAHKLFMGASHLVTQVDTHRSVFWHSINNKDKTILASTCVSSNGKAPMSISDYIHDFFI